MHFTGVTGAVLARVALCSSFLVALGGCSEREDEPAETTFYSRRVEPILHESCAASPTRSGCHVKSEDQRHALGNLSFDTYEDLALRRDLLTTYGPYGVPGLLLKVVPDFKVGLTSWKSVEPVTITTRIAHVGDQGVDFTSPAFTTIDSWIKNGAAENNASIDHSARPNAPCPTTVGKHPAFDPGSNPASADYAVFTSGVNTILGQSCAAGNCHGAQANALYLTCGTSDEQSRWNYFAAADYLSSDPEASEILRRVLAGTSGGTYHEGGAIFDSIEDLQYQKILEWARAKAGPSRVPADPGFEFFADRVQPMLVKRGCMQLNCHSAAMFHDYRLRGGSGGHFGLAPTRKNYELSLEQVALESPDPRASRIIRKNLSPGLGGILHRGGALFGNGATCDMAAAETGPIDEQEPYCVLSAWIRKEREARLGTAEPLSGIVFVRRPPKTGADTPQDWAEFEPGAEVIRAALTRAEDGALTVGAETSLSAACGLDPAGSEARRPAVSWDGTRVAFSARTGAAEPFRIYVVDNGACQVEPDIDASPVDDKGAPVLDNGELVHNLDPAFAPDGRIVFVSTRGNIANTSSFTYQGPQRTPADPSKLNSNLYIRDADGSIRQLTFLLNQELLPSFMRDGRLILSAEKRAPGFYQLAGRRMNLDGADYHPLFGQRSTIGFNQLSDLIELADKNFAMILSDRGARHGAGTLAILNRSIGVDQHSGVEADYLVDPGAIGFPNPDFYQRSMKLWDAAATGKGATAGAYQGPSPLPDGRLLASYAASAADLGTFSGGFDIVVVDPVRDPGVDATARSVLISGPQDELWPVAVYAKQNLGVFQSRMDEANAATLIDPSLGGRSQISVLDVPVLESLLFQNTRTGRKLPEDGSLEVWESLPPEPGVTSFANGGRFVTDDAFGSVYVRRARVGALDPYPDGSAKFLLRGGMPLVLATNLQLAGDAAPTKHFQREEMQFYPNENARQSFKRSLFNGLCAGCHGSVQGPELHAAVKPDVLTSASDVQALEVGNPAADLSVLQGNPEGPEFP
ncbi:MAG: hypothetical protein M3020_00735 [Myxococcota bacterium]|nr:hypothetical protein [Myxococcota bacterium]